MIEPYTAVGLIPSFWGIRRREDIEKNLEHLESLTKAAFWLSNLDIPVRLVAIPEIRDRILRPLICFCQQHPVREITVDVAPQLG